MPFDIPPGANVRRDDAGVLRQATHTGTAFRPDESAAHSPQALAIAYLREVADQFDIPSDALDELGEPLEGDLVDEEVRLAFAEQKRTRGIVTVSFVQGLFGLPIWEAGFSVTMRGDPLGVVRSRSSYHHDAKAEPPDDEAPFLPDNLDEGDLREVLRIQRKEFEVDDVGLRIYQYDPEARFHPESNPPDQVDEPPQPAGPHRSADVANEASREPPAQTGGPPVLPLPAVPDEIEAGRHYVVTEVLFSTPAPNEEESVNWRAFVEPETGAVLYLRAFVAHVSGMVYETDPIDQTGDTSITPGDSTMALNGYRSSVTLPGLDSPTDGTQELTGDYVELSDFDSPTEAPPTESTGDDFDYDATSDDFAAVNAYYHCDALFRLMDDMGFDLDEYFDDTDFPIPVDHDALDGNVNAAVQGNSGGVGARRIKFGKCVSGESAGIATESRTVMHEFGHVILFDSINDGTFDFAHSPGDALAVILNDPDTGLTGSDRWIIFNWCPLGTDRRADRDPAAGWGWDGSQDTGGYSSEEILTTTLVRFYRAIGGDSSRRSLRRFASRYAAYLIFAAVGSFAASSIVPPANPDDFEAQLEVVDGDDFEGNAGGAYDKVIRWSFEQQGLYEGDPPPVDVYIDDGRAGEYDYQRNFWSSSDIWNRHTDDGGTDHERPILDTTNYLYVRVSNRGSERAEDVDVRGFKCRPGAGLVWPDDWTPLATAELTGETVDAGGETIVGPFEWTPSEAGHECLLFIADADADPSNVDPSQETTVTGSIPHWRLVPHDNNIGQRNVEPEAGGGGREGLMESFAEHDTFWLNNPFTEPADATVHVSLPDVLTSRRWELLVGAGQTSFTLEARGSQALDLRLVPGGQFSAEDIQDGDAIEITAEVNGIPIGGVTYQLDPTMAAAPTEPDTGPAVDLDELEDALDCLDDYTGDLDRVQVKRVLLALDFELEDCD